MIATRSRLMSRLAGQGAVALLELDAEATAALIADFPGVSLTVYASPRQTVISGPVAPVDAVIAAVTAQDRFARRVNMEVASHTALMDPILPELRSALADLTPKAPTIPFISTIADHHHAGVGRRVLGRQCAPAGAVQPSRHHRRRASRHLHRNQPPSHTDACHHRNPGIHPPPQHRHAVARR